MPKEFDGYALIVGKNGHKLAPGSDEPPSIMGSRGRVTAKNAPMIDLAQFLSTELKATVVDRTGLKGGYTFSFSLPAPDDPSEHHSWLHEFRTSPSSASRGRQSEKS